MIGSRMHVKLWQHMNWHTAFRVVQIHHMKTIIKPYLTASKKRISHIFRRLEFKVFFPTPDDIPDSRRDTVTNAVSVASVVTPPLKDKQDKGNQFWIGFAGNWPKFDLTLKNVLHFQQNSTSCSNALGILLHECLAHILKQMLKRSKGRVYNDAVL